MPGSAGGRLLSYTEGVKDYLVKEGYAPDRIFDLNNTVDLVLQRRLYLKIKPQRKELCRQMRLDDRMVFIFVGWSAAQKRIDFLLEAFKTVAQKKTSQPFACGV